MTDTRKLKAVLALRGLTAKDLAEKIGMTGANLSLRMTNKREFRASEILKVAEVLRLSMDEKEQIFFAKPVDE